MNAKCKYIGDAMRVCLRKSVLFSIHSWIKNYMHKHQQGYFEHV